MSQIDPDVLKAILAGTTSVRRRIEVFQSDATTLWLPIDDSSRIIDGSVTVSADRDERRSFELTLDNSDGLIDHDPEGFYYDKIIKIYRGINYRNDRPTPRIVVINDNATYKVIPFLKQLGYTNIVDRTSMATTIEDLYGYDLIVNNSAAASPSTISKTILEQAQDIGINVFTMSSRATSAEVPLIASTATTGVPWTFAPVTTVDTPFSQSYTSHTVALAGSSPLAVTALATGAYAGAVDVSGTVNYPLSYRESGSGAKWVHYQATVPATPGTQMRRMFLAALTWLYRYADWRSFEVQVGEFMIDSISTQDFPHTLKASGRDYAKKLINSVFRNTVTFAAGTSLDSLALGVAGAVGITKTLLITNGATVPADITFERDTTRWEAIKKIHQDQGFDVFFNAQGYLVTRPSLDPTLSPSSVTLSTGGTTGNLVSFSKSSTDAQVKNVVVVVGQNQDDLSGGNIWLGVAENKIPDSPTSIDRLGPREYIYVTPFVKSHKEAKALADKYLKVSALESFDLSFSSLVLPWLEVGEIAQFVDPDPSKGEPKRYLLTDITIPLTLGAMTGSGKRITIVGTPETADTVSGTEGLGGTPV